MKTMLISTGSTESEIEPQAVNEELFILAYRQSAVASKYPVRNHGKRKLIPAFSAATRFIAVASLLALTAGRICRAQADLPDAPKPQAGVAIRNVPRYILQDQKGIWTSPAHVKIQDLDWLVPLAAGTALTIATDQSAMNHVVSKNPSFNSKNIDVSNAMIGGFIATPVVLYGFGHVWKSPHAREAGILTGEAMLDSVVVEQGMKLAFWRERPSMNNASGHFFKSDAGIDSAFPSSHSVVAWSAAAVLAGEYHSHLTQLLIYSAATGISLTRVMGQQHFPSDVLVGSAAGWLVGRYVFRKHHNEALTTNEDY